MEVTDNVISTGIRDTFKNLTEEKNLFKESLYVGLESYRNGGEVLQLYGIIGQLLRTHESCIENKNSSVRLERKEIWSFTVEVEYRCGRKKL